MIKITTETSDVIERSNRYDALIAPTSVNGRCASPFAGYIHQQHDILNKMAMSPDYTPGLGNYIYHRSDLHLLIRLPVLPVLLEPRMTGEYARQAVGHIVDMLHMLRNEGFKNVVVPNIKVNDKYIPFIHLMETLVKEFSHFDDFTVYVTSRNYNLENMPSWIEIIKGEDPTATNPTLNGRRYPTPPPVREALNSAPASNSPYANYFKRPVLN